MSGKLISVVGELMGRRVSARVNGPWEEVVRIVVEGRPEGPAENSLIIVQVSPTGEKRARYLSWIGYQDLDEASAAEPGAWRLVEPAAPYRERVDWHPFD